MKENSNIDHQAPWSRVRGDFSFERDTDQIVLLSKSSRENETALPKREENSNFEHMSMNVEPHCRPQMLQSKSHEQMVRALFQLQLFQNHLSTSAIPVNKERACEHQATPGALRWAIDVEHARTLLLVQLE